MTVRTHREATVMIVTIDRHDVRNAVDAATASAIEGHAVAGGLDEGVRRFQAGEGRGGAPLGPSSP